MTIVERNNTFWRAADLNNDIDLLSYTIDKPHTAARHRTGSYGVDIVRMHEPLIFVSRMAGHLGSDCDCPSVRWCSRTPQMYETSSRSWTKTREY